MKRAPTITYSLVVVLALVVLIAVFTAVALSQQVDSPGTVQTVAPTSSTPCVPTPQLIPPTDIHPNTATPSPGDATQATPVPGPSVTPLPLSQTTDLATGLPDEEKVYVYVYRCNGTYELFKISPGGPNADIPAAIPLQPGDVILYWIQPAALMGHVAPTVTPLSTTSTLTPPTAYPGPPTAYPGPAPTGPAP